MLPTTASAIPTVPGPETRTIPIPPRPGGVDTAAIVSIPFTPEIVSIEGSPPPSMGGRLVPEGEQRGRVKRRSAGRSHERRPSGVSYPDQVFPTIFRNPN